MKVDNQPVFSKMKKVAASGPLGENYWLSSSTGLEFALLHLVLIIIFTFIS